MDSAFFGEISSTILRNGTFVFCLNLDSVSFAFIYFKKIVIEKIDKLREIITAMKLRPRFKRPILIAGTFICVFGFIFFLFQSTK